MDINEHLPVWHFLWHNCRQLSHSNVCWCVETFSLQTTQDIVDAVDVKLSLLPKRCVEL